MSNVQTVQAIYEAFGRGDIPFILDQLAADVAWEQWDDHRAQKAGVDYLQARHGRDGAAEFFAIVGEMEFRDFQVLDVLGGDHQVAAEVVIEAVRPSGAQIRDEELHLWTFGPDGKVTRFRHYVDTAKHIEAYTG
jgi:ketosteroid isomerase-like protein